MSQKPPPPPSARFASFGGPPPPLSRGRMSASVLAMHRHPSFATKRFAISPSKEGAERRQAHHPWPCLRSTAARLAIGALASRRSTAALAWRANAEAQSRPRFTHSGGCGCYPHHRARLSEAPRAPVIMPAGTMPGPPGSGVTSPARRNRILLHFRDRLEKRP
jgi:hypothetical protein